MTRRTQLARVPLAQALLARLSYAQQRELDAAAPTHLTLPTGTRVRVDYESAGAPLAAVRLQEVFGLAATPRLGRAQVPVTLQLLSPGAAAAAGDARPGELLARRLRRGAQGHARALSASLLAGGSARPPRPPAACAASAEARRRPPAASRGRMGYIAAPR